ncbi:MAG: DUF3501 family protein [Candidatus Binataceae bacterium]
MKPVTIDRILGFEQWERVRPVLRPLFIREKERRRLAVGAHLTLLFENAQTVWYQVEEMVRAERMSDPDAVQHELDTYNELLPAAGELSATLLIEYADARERDEALSKLVGLDRHLYLRMNDRRVPARFDENQMETGAISAVQFVRFSTEGADADQLIELAAAGALAVEVDHPSLTAKAPIAGTFARALAEDLREE